ncbi:anti-ECF sigma factor ChrR [Catenovulum agarivorans DS-2]|uniref:Anti-ECF sigma factor ChrR n=1 Tax=Catenovulum agarivorans DS-2 TaxID=1328313 RepID=W7QNB6_9ALTE|nr:ChrR family anti-sigma-E factor [Catenovulum agarivorans]EWH09398.1 anti-ECF sigma factor ChrR [Catenovulum agarivorans DS-2]
MIKHHPKHELLTAFVAGELPAALNIAISAHVEMCEQCQHALAALTEAKAEEVFSVEDFSVFESLNSDLADELDELMIANITSQKGEYTDELVDVRSVDYAGKQVVLPRALNSVDWAKFQGVGKLSRARLDLDEGSVRSYLLQIAAGGSVPMHTHKGYEVTVLLDGTFEDEMCTYNKGDFIWLDESFTHSPVSNNGCLCLTVADDAPVFTEGLSKLLNPIGRFIY